MEDEFERPAKRSKISSSVGNEMKKTDSDQIKQMSRSRSKTKKVGRSTVMNTIQTENTFKRKAMQVSDWKNMQDKSSGAQKIGTIIDIDSELSSERSSPFKIIRSSQEFSFDSPIHRRIEEQRNKSVLNSGRLSSDDGIFWIATPRTNQEKKNTIDNNIENDNTNTPKLPSSPLKEDKSFDNSLPDTLLDAEMKKLLTKYATINNGKPSCTRSNSDSRVMNLEDQANTSQTQIVATKNTLNESILKSLSCQNMRKTNSKTLDLKQQKKIDFSERLTQIGSTLMTQAPPDQEIEASQFEEILRKNIDGDNTKNEHLKERFIETTTAKESSNDDVKSDTFSDDIDFDEILNNAMTQNPVNTDQRIAESQDEFSDDDNLMDQIDLVIEQTQTHARETIRCAKNETTATEYMGSVDDDTKLDTGVKLLNLNEISKAETDNPINEVKYKGMKIEAKNSEGSTKQFELFNENDNLAKSALKFESLKRLQIKNVRSGVYKVDGRVHKQYILKCITPDDTFVNVIVRDHWASLELKMNDVIHIVTTHPDGKYQLVDKEHNLLIWNPDTLLSATRVSEAVDCRRKAIINQKFSGIGEVSVPFIIGNIVHSLFQACLIFRRIDDEFAEDKIEKELESHLIEIYAAKKNKEEIRNIILEHFSYIKEWIKEYVPMPYSEVMYRKNTEFKATNILDIEENIMSPVFGIRGLIDVVIEATLNDGRALVVPLEIKTGKEYLSNKVQVSLYTLLIKQRYGVESFYTSLVYTKLHQCYLSAIKSNDFKLLVNIRNELSQFLAYGVTELPSILQRSACERCFVVESCMVLNKLVENGTAEDSGIEPEIYNDLTKHLNNKKYSEYFKKWDKLITKEEGLLNFTKTDLWRNTAEYREKNGGNCVGSLHLVAHDHDNSSGKFVYIFERSTSKFPPLTSSQLAKNDRIILSDEDSKFGLTWGFIKYLRPELIAIVTDRNWSDSAVKMKGFDKENNQKFRSVLRVSQSSRLDKGDENTQNSSQILPSYVTNKTFRIDKDQMFHGMTMARFNILNLFMPGGDSKSRELIVELKTPRFDTIPAFKYNINSSNMNEDQIKAIDVASKTKDYCLLLGMPGTGKTTVITSIVENIVNNGMTVLISSYTHSAVDNICEKLIKHAKEIKKDLPLLRVGSPSNMNPIVRPYCIYSEEFSNQVKDKNEFRDVLDNSQIVAVTCLGINDVALGMAQKFDYCIIDEASQVALPVVLGPISFADKFILVGDHYQLPPLVLHPEARQEGLDESLFKILSNAHPQSVVELTHQYRMCSDIMSLSNELIYNGRLKCGSELVANQILNIPFLDKIPLNHTCINDIVDPQKRVIFINEDMISSFKEVSIGEKIENPGEAKLISSVIKAMILGGVNQEDIGVMSFYKAQLRHFFTQLRRYKNLEILTADRFQGRDKKVIIISLVRTEAIGDLLKEWRRVNVAMTRAKCKLIIFGSKKLLKSVEQFEGFMEIFESNKWIYNLKPGDEKIDDFTFLENEADEEGIDIFSSNTSRVKSIDRNSNIILRTKILKHIIDELN